MTPDDVEIAREASSSAKPVREIAAATGLGIDGRGSRSADSSIDSVIAPSTRRKLMPPLEPYETFSTNNSELVIGIVGALGADNSKLCRMLISRLDVYGYKAIEIRLSRTVIPALAGELDAEEQSAFDRANALINMGNKVRHEAKNNAVLAIAAAAEVARRRPNPEGPISKVAYIVSSLNTTTLRSGPLTLS